MPLKTAKRAPGGSVGATAASARAPPPVPLSQGDGGGGEGGRGRGGSEFDLYVPIVVCCACVFFAWRPKYRCTNTGLYACQRFLLPIPVAIQRVRGAVSMDTVFLCRANNTAAAQCLGAGIITRLLFPDQKALLVPLMRILFC